MDSKTYDLAYICVQVVWTLGHIWVQLKCTVHSADILNSLLTAFSGCYSVQSLQAWVAGKSDILLYYIISIFPENSTIAPPNPVSCSNPTVTLTSCVWKTLTMAFFISYWTVHGAIVYCTDIKQQKTSLSLHCVNRIPTLLLKSNLGYILLNTINYRLVNTSLETVLYP